MLQTILDGTGEPLIQPKAALLGTSQFTNYGAADYANSTGTPLPPDIVSAAAPPLQTAVNPIPAPSTQRGSTFAPTFVGPAFDNSGAINYDASVQTTATRSNGIIPSPNFNRSTDVPNADGSTPGGVVQIYGGQAFVNSAPDPLTGVPNSVTPPAGSLVTTVLAPSLGAPTVNDIISQTVTPPGAVVQPQAVPNPLYTGGGGVATGVTPAGGSSGPGATGATGATTAGPTTGTVAGSNTDQLTALEQALLGSAANANVPGSGSVGGGYGVPDPTSGVTPLTPTKTTQSGPNILVIVLLLGAAALAYYVYRKQHAKAKAE